MKRVGLIGVVSLTFVGSMLAQDWLPFSVPWDDAAATSIDASGLLLDFPGQDPATVIDSRGRVRAGSDGHFHFEKTGRRARFWGVNFVFNACFPPSPEQPLRSGEFPDRQVAEKVAAHLAKMGVNVVRFHHMDFFASPDGIFDPGQYPNNTLHLDMGQLARLDYLTYQLRRHGIYVNLNLKVARHFGPGDGLPDTQGFSGPSDFSQGVSHYDARMIELQRDYARQLLTHRNPYTGLTYAEDPGVLCVEIANEDSLFGALLNEGGLNHAAGVADSIPAYYSDELDRLWNDWLRAKYGSQSLEEVWSTGLPEVDTTDRIRNGGFEQGLAEWAVYPIEGAQVQASVQAGAGPDGSAALRVQVQSDGVNWHVQAVQNGHRLVRGQLYRITFQARSSKPAPITLDMTKGAPPWQNYGLSRRFDVTTQWERYQATFVANESDPETARPTFELGQTSATLWLDQVEFRETRPTVLEDGESLSLGTVIRPSRSQLAEAAPGRVQDLFRFYTQLDESYFTGMRDYVRNQLRSGVMVTGTAPWWAFLGDTATQSKLDFVDGHFYWDHPSWPNTAAWSPTGWRITNTSFVNNLESLNSLASQAVEGKPFTVSEFNHVFPNRYALEGPLVIAAVANLQDWDAVYLFDYAGSSANFDDPFTTSFFSLSGNPVKTAQLPVASRIFLGRQSEPASKNLRVDLNRDELTEGYVQGLINASDFLNRKGLPRSAFLQSRLRMGTFDLAEPKPVEHPEPEGAVVSSNGEVTWNGASGEKRLTVRGSAVQAAVGFLPPENDFGWWSFTVEEPGHLAVVLQSMDRFPLDESRRLLLSLWSEHANTGMVWNATETTVENHWGRAPTVLRRVRLTLRLKLEDVRIYPLDSTGARQPALSGSPSGDGVSFDIDTARDGAVWYEIATGRDSGTIGYHLQPGELLELYSELEADPARIGWASIGQVQSSPSTLALLEYYSRGTLTSLVRLPSLAASGRTWAPTVRDASTDTAVAVVNPGREEATAELRLVEADARVRLPSVVLKLAPGQADAFYVLDRMGAEGDFLGALEVSSPTPVVVTAMRSSRNVFGDVILTPLPASPAIGSSLYLAQLVAGGDYRSEILVSNPQGQATQAQLRLFDESGEPSEVGGLSDTTPLDLEPGETRRLVLSSDGSTFSGYARLDVADGGSLVATAVVSYQPGGAFLSEVAVPVAPAQTDWDLTVLERPLRQSALAVVNPTASPLTVALELTSVDGLQTKETAEVPLQPGQKKAFFLRELFPDLAETRQAFLRVSAPRPVGLLPLLGVYNDRGEFLLASLAAPSPAGSDSVSYIPRLVSGFGFRTILQLTPPQGGTDGVLNFFDQTGAPMEVPFRRLVRARDR